MSSATFIGFVATFASLSISFLMAGLRPIILGEFEFTFDYLLLGMVFFMAMRHQVRVVFMDSFYIENNRAEESWILEFWLILIISIFGGIMLTIYFYGRSWMSLFMVLYCILFTLLGLRVFKKKGRSIEATRGMKLSEWRKWDGYPKELWGVSISLIVDFLLLCLWVFWLINLLVSKSEPDPIAIAFAFFAVLLFIFGEAQIVFKKPVLKRLGDAKKMLFKG